MVCFAFWFGEVRSLVVSYNLSMLVLSGQYIPIRLFPENFLHIIKDVYKWMFLNQKILKKYIK